MILSKDFRDLLQLLNENGVEYFIVGGCLHHDSHNSRIDRISVIKGVQIFK